MLGKKIKRLEKLKGEYQARLDSIHEVDADPTILTTQISNLQYAIVCLEDQIDFEKRIRIFRYTLYAFALIAAAIVAIVIFKTT